MNQILTWSATCCMWRVETVSKWEDKKNYCFAVCQKKTHGKPWLCRVSQKSTRQSISLPCALILRVFSWAHSAKIMFAVCPWICTRQTMVYTAKSKFPVVYSVFAGIHIMQVVTGSAITLKTVPEPIYSLYNAGLQTSKGLERPYPVCRKSKRVWQDSSA